MSDYDWGEMTPEERDALVAEKVMGWEKSVDPDNPNETVYISPGDPNWRKGHRPPFYTRRINYAWDIVEKLEEDGWGLRLSTYADGDRDATFVHVVGSKAVSAYERSAPESICRAALRVKGVDV